MCICIRTRMYACIFNSSGMHISIREHFFYVCVCVYVCKYGCVSVVGHDHLCTFEHGVMHVFTYTHIHTYIHAYVSIPVPLMYVWAMRDWLFYTHLCQCMHVTLIEIHYACSYIYIYIYIYIIYNIYVCVYIHTWGWAFCRRIVEEQYSKKLSQIKFSENCDQTVAWEAWVLLYTFTWLAWAQLSLLCSIAYFDHFGGRSMKVGPELRSLHLQASVRPYAVRLLWTPTTWNHVHLR